MFGNELEKYYAVELQSNEKSEMFFSDAVPRPLEGVACLSFRYKKYLKGKYGIDLIRHTFATTITSICIFVAYEKFVPRNESGRVEGSWEMRLWRKEDR